MKPYFIAALFFSSLSISSLSCAQNQSNEVGKSTPRWTCSAYDKDHKHWVAQSSYEIAATNKALAGCKKESRYPGSCKIDKEQCDPFVRQVSGAPNLWKCTALDQMAKTWVNNPRSQRDEAALAAKSLCKIHSSMPDTCYINLLTCVNVQSGL